MRSLLAFLFVGIVTASANAAPLRALLVCGGCCHDYANQSRILRDGIQARANVRVDVIRCDDSGTSPYFPMYDNPDWAKGYDVVIHDECAADIKDMTYVRHIVDAHKNGVAAVNLHCAMHSYRTGTPIWFEYLGLQSSVHGEQLPIAIDFKNTDHPITRGIDNWTTGPEELYNNVRIFDTAKPLALGSQTQNGKVDTTVVVWTNEYNGTKIFNTTLGHNNATVGDERYLKMIVQGLLWSCGKLNANYLKPYIGPAGRFEVIPAQAKPAPARGVPANATFVKVTVSSQQVEHPQYHAVDGAGQTRWCASSEAYPQWYQMELEKPQELTGIRISWEKNNIVYRYQVDVSSDGKDWKLAADESKNDKAGDTTATFARTTAKFLRITCLGSSQPANWASIWEVSVEGQGVGPLFGSTTEAKEANVAAGKAAEAAAKTAAEAASLQSSGNSKPVISQLSPEQEAAILKDVKVADGFDLTLFANSAAANYPVYVASAPNGDLYVASDGNGSGDRAAQRGRVVRLRDTDNDGRADQVTEFVNNVDSPRGMVWDHDRLYLIHPPDISCYIDKNGDGVSDEEKVLVKGIAYGFADRPADHTTNGLSLGIDGWLYIAGGDFGFRDAVGTDGRHLQHRAGGVIRVRPDGSGMEIFSTGTRNILGTPISPLLDIFARDNTNDGGGWNVRFHHFTGMEDHGYPRMYMNFNDEIVQPLADYGGGSGCGSVYLSEPGIPAKWNNAPFTCDWGTNALWHHEVQPDGATFKETSKPEALIQMTRPTDADVDGRSRIYQASWKGATFSWVGPDVGYIVRVTPKGYTPEPLPDFSNAGEAKLVKLLESPSQVRTLEAQRTLLRRPGSASMKNALLALAGNSSKPLPARVAALYALTQRGVKADNAASIIQAVTPLATDTLLQRFVLRALSDAGLDRLPAGKPIAPLGLYAAGLKSSDPRTRLEAIIGSTRQHMSELAPQITNLLGDRDPVIAHTAFRSLSMMNAAAPCFKVLDNRASSAAQRTGALRALMRMHLPEVARNLIERLKKSPENAAREELLTVLCRLYFREGEWKGDSWGTRPDTRGPYYQPEAWSETPAIDAALRAELERATPESAAVLTRELKRNRIEFKEAIQRMMVLIKANPSLLPNLVAQLASLESVPAEGIPYLVNAARGNWPIGTLAQAVETLAKTDSAEGCIASLAALDKLSKTKDADKERDVARNALFAAPKLENHHHLLETEAAKLDGGMSQWADAALLTLSARKDGSPESREASKIAIAEGWKNPKRRVQILKAIKSIEFHELDDQVREAVNDADAAVAQAAKETVTSLKLDQKSEDKTPLVSTLKPEEVIAEVLKAKGDVGTGQQIFARAGCVACHTVSSDELQKGPFLGNIAQTYNRADLAVNILDPQKTIAQGFTTEMFTLKSGGAQMGFVTLESADQVKIRDMAGHEFVWKTAEIAKREKLPTSLMPPGLVSSSTILEFASLLDYLESLSKK